MEKSNTWTTYVPGADDTSRRSTGVGGESCDFFSKTVTLKTNVCLNICQVVTLVRLNENQFENDTLFE